MNIDKLHVSRSVNSNQRRALISLIGDHPMVNNKSQDPRNIRKKALAWDDIARQFGDMFPSSQGYTPKTPINLKRWWENYRQKLKKNQAQRRMYACGTGGGPALPPDDDVDLAAAELIKAELSFGENQMDSMPPIKISAKASSPPTHQPPSPQVSLPVASPTPGCSHTVVAPAATPRATLPAPLKTRTLTLLPTAQLPRPPKATTLPPPPTTLPQSATGLTMPQPPTVMTLPQPATGLTMPQPPTFMTLPQPQPPKSITLPQPPTSITLPQPPTATPPSIWHSQYTGASFSTTPITPQPSAAHSSSSTATCQPPTPSPPFAQTRRKRREDCYSILSEQQRSLHILKEKYLREEHELQMEVLNAKKKQDEIIYLNIAKREQLLIELLQMKKKHEEELFMMKKKQLQIQMDKDENE